MAEQKTEEQGFSAEELADIMNEIETLEGDFLEKTEEGADPEQTSVVPEEVEASKEEPPKEEQVAAPVEEVQEVQEVQEEEEVEAPASVEVASGDSVSLDDFAKEIQDDSKEIPSLQSQIDQDMAATVEVSPQEITSLDDHREVSTGSSKMDFHLTNEKNLDLVFHFEGKVITLHVQERQGLEVELDGGLRFTLPHNNDKKQQVS